MKNLKIFIFLNIILIITSCGTIKEGFTNQKKNNSDEFLVEKKSPLVMPPKFNELPVPNSSNKKTKKNEDTIESLISNSETKTDNNIKDSDQNLKKNILDKIKE